MRAFRYRLAPALKRAQYAERVLQMELTRLEDQLHRVDLRLKRLRSVRDALRRRLRALHGEDVDLGRVNLARQDLDQVDSLLQRAARARRDLEDRISAARDRLLQAARERQNFEKHRDGLAQHHRRAELAADTKRLDDLATLRFSLRGGHKEELR